jgi:hypothetical protein
MLVTGTADVARPGAQGAAASVGPPIRDPGLDAVASAGFNRSCGERRNRSPDGIVVIQMVWWEAVLFFAAVIFAIYAFASIVGFRTRTLTRPTDRTAQDMYDN